MIQGTKMKELVEYGSNKIAEEQTIVFCLLNNFLHQWFEVICIV